MSKMRWCYGLLAVLACAIAIVPSACSLEDFKTEEAARSPQLVQSILSDPKTFNAALSQESPNVFSYIYEGLTTTNGLTAEVEPALAESWEISDDNLTIIFTLREGLKWSDGEPLTADDVVFTYNDIYFNEAIPVPIRDVLRVGEKGELPKVEKIDDRRIRFTLPEPFSPILRAMSAEILPEHALRSTVEKTDSQGDPEFNSTWGTGTDPDEIIGNGMYVLNSYSPGQRVTFRRNPYYWREGQPYIDRVVWQVVENQDTALLQFRSGGLDALSVAPQYFSLLKQEEERGNFTIYEDGPALGTTFMTFNLNTGRRPNGEPLVEPYKSKWFNTPEFRKAIAHALDRNTMVNTIYRGLGEEQNSPISFQSPYYLSPKEGLPTYDYDPEKAKELLRSVGFEYNDRGELFDAEGNRVRFTLLTNAGNQIREALGAQIKQDLSKIGIQVDFTPIAFSTLVDKLNKNLDWEAHLIGFTGGVDPAGQMTIWDVEGRLHSFNQEHPEYELEGREVRDWERQIESLFVRGSQVFDEQERKEIYGEAQIVAQENLPFIYLVNPYSMGAVRDRVENVQYSAVGGGAFWNLYELRLSEGEGE